MRGKSKHDKCTTCSYYGILVAVCFIVHVRVRIYFFEFINFKTNGIIMINTKK